MEETKAEKKERLRIEQAERRAYLRGEAMLGYGCVSSTVIRKRIKKNTPSLWKPPRLTN